MKCIRTAVLLFLTLLLSINLVKAQNTFNIKGIVTDTLKNPLIEGAALLLIKTDSTMVDYGRTQMDGSFKFKNVKPGEYLVKTTYLGYLPVTVDADVVDKNINLDTLKMSELASELME